MSNEEIAMEAAERWFDDFGPPGDTPGKYTLQNIILDAIQKSHRVPAAVPEGKGK